jgi:hypothetical protein
MRRASVADFDLDALRRLAREATEPMDYDALTRLGLDGPEAHFISELVAAWPAMAAALERVWRPPLTRQAASSSREGRIDPPVPPASAAVKPRLTTTRTAGVLVDQRGRMWLVDDARLPHSNRERDVCDGCGRQLGDVAYLEHRVDGAIRCAACVEVG